MLLQMLCHLLHLLTIRCLINALKEPVHGEWQAKSAKGKISFLPVQIRKQFQLGMVECMYKLENNSV